MIDSIDIGDFAPRMRDVIDYVQTENDTVDGRGVAVIGPFYATNQLELDRSDRERSIEDIAGDSPQRTFFAVHPTCVAPPATRATAMNT